MQNPDLSIIIVNWNTRSLLKNCLNSIYQKTKGVEFEIFVVDNASQDQSAEMVEREFPNAKLIKNRKNLGFAAANNQAIKKATGKFILLLNSDTIVLDAALEKMVNFIKKQPDAGIVGCKLLDKKGAISHSILDFPTLCKTFTNHYLPRTLNQFVKKKLYNKTHTVEAISGACLMTKKEVIKKVGLLDEKFFMFTEDVDWCYRVKKVGWKIYFFPKAKIIHLGGQSTRRVSDDFSVKYVVDNNFYFFTKHHGRLPAFLYQWLILGRLILALIFYSIYSLILKVFGQKLQVKNLLKEKIKLIKRYSNIHRGGRLATNSLGILIIL